jgi:methionine aminopeptidase
MRKTMANTESKGLMIRLLDYTLNNPDTLAKYKTAAQISEKVLAEVSRLCVAGEKIVSICEKGDKLIEEEIAKVYRGKKILKGSASLAPTHDGSAADVFLSDP